MASLLPSWRACMGIALFSSNLLTAQSVCDSLQIVSLTYAPFTDTALQVTVLNTSVGELFDYPRFCLVSEGGDTLAREQLNFFGIGWGEQMHRMDRVPGAALPSTPFTGTLVLVHATVGGDEVCTFPIISSALCPAACVPLQVYLYPEFGSFTTSSFLWNMSDSTGAEVASGQLNIYLDSVQQALDTLCLVPGAYTLHMAQPIPSGTAFQFGVTQGVFVTDGPFAVLPAGSGMDLPFTYYPACTALGLGLADEPAPAPLFIFNAGRVTITDPRARALGEVTVCDALGRCIQRSTTNASTVTIDLSSLSTGAYLISVMNSTRTTQRIVMP